MIPSNILLSRKNEYQWVYENYSIPTELRNRQNESIMFKKKGGVVTRSK